MDEIKIFFAPYKEINKIVKLNINTFVKAELLSILCRLNTLAIIKLAGSGHIGSSFSALDIFVWLKHFQIKNKNKNLKDKSRNIFFSSKGHDVPALYSVLYSLGILSTQQMLRLRRFKGLDGHPDIRIKGVEANTGSLGMGISKAKGILWAKKYLKKKGQVVVLTGDGEFQEGQIFESLQTTSHQSLNDLIVIMDHNKIQSSQYVKDVICLGELKKKIKSFGWFVTRCNGHNFKNISKAFDRLKKINNKPKFLILDTIKGKGVSFMEHTKVMQKQKIYNWHAGAPDDKNFLLAQKEIIQKIKTRFKKYKISCPLFLNIKDNKKIVNKTVEFH
jgi:transketolase